MNSKKQILWLVMVLLPLAGCGGRQPQKAEWFIFVADGLPQPVLSSVAQEFQTLVGETASPGDVVHFISAPDHQPVAMIEVPSGGRNSRLKHPNVRGELPKLQELFTASDAQSSSQLELPSVPATVQALRRTEFPARIVLIGDPVYKDERYEGWAMGDSSVPTDGALASSTCPFHVATKLPTDAAIGWLTPSADWGDDNRHREAITRFYRLFAQQSGGKLVRITPSANSAFDIQGGTQIEEISPKNDGIGMRKVSNEVARQEVEVIAPPQPVEVAQVAATEAEQVLAAAEADHGQIAIAINWTSRDPNCDIDLYVRSKGASEELFYSRKQTSFGTLYRDVTSSGSASANASDYQKWEWAKIEHNRIGDLTIWLNSYSSTQPATVRVICVWQGVRYQKSYEIRGRGDGGEGGSWRSVNSSWRQVAWNNAWPRI